MKKLTTLLLVVALLLIPVRAADAEVTPPEPLIAKCLIAVIVIGVGYIIIRGLIKLCQCIPDPYGTNINTNCPPYNTNRNSTLTNGNLARLNSPVTLQSTRALGTMFVENYQFTFVQTEKGVECVASAGGVPVLTNSPSMLEHRGPEDYAEYDFRSLPQSGNFFRLVSLEEP